MDASGFNVIGRIPRWFNLGKRDKPHAGRRTGYFKEWFRASGVPPKRADRLPHSVFLKRMAKVQVADVQTESPYSVVRDVLSWETRSFNQSDLLINQSNNQLINEGIRKLPSKQHVVENACQHESEREKEKCAIESNDAFRTSFVPISTLAG